MKQTIRKIAAILVLALFIVNTYGQITEIGLASFYADKFDGRVTASGDIFDQSKMTAAHRTLPFGSKVKVTNLENFNDIIVIINDRGPFVNDRVIDLSKAGAKKLGFVGKGVTKVKIEVLSIPNDNKPASKNKAYIPPAKKGTKPTGVTTANVVVAGSVANQEIEYFKVKSEKIVPKGYGIQVASYKEAANLIKRCDEIHNKTGKEVIIQVGSKSGEKVYRIILGPFLTREDATQFNNSLQTTYKGSFVIGF